LGVRFDALRHNKELKRPKSKDFGVFVEWRAVCNTRRVTFTARAGTHSDTIERLAMVRATKALSLNIETLRELTLEDAAKVNGGRHHKTVSSVMPTVTAPVSSVMPGPATGVQPTSSARPPVHHHRHHR
jgi:hypothetical protein